MLKITSRNEKLNRRMARKETTRFLYKLFCCFFVSPIVSRKLKSYRNNDRSLHTTKSSPMSLKRNNFYLLKPLSKHQILNFQLQRYFVNWQSQLLLKSSFTKTRTICFLTGRSRSIYRHFRLSRLKLRQYAAVGFFTGLAKASW